MDANGASTANGRRSSFVPATARPTSNGPSVSATSGRRDHKESLFSNPVQAAGTSFSSGPRRASRRRRRRRPPRRGDDRRLRQGPDAEQRHAHDPERRPEPQLHPAGPRQLRQHPPVPADLRVPLAGRHRERRRLGRNQRYRWSYYGMRRRPRRTTATIFVAPQGINNGWANSSGQDVTFVDDMVSQIESGLCVDTTQLFSVGLQLRRRDDLRPRVRPGDGLPRGRGLLRREPQRVQRRHPARSPTSGLHGLRDNVLPISPGRALRDTFVRNNGCTPQNPPEPAQGSLTHIVTAYSGCRAGYPVVWAAFDGGPRPRSGRRIHRVTAARGPGPRRWCGSSSRSSELAPPSPPPTSPHRAPAAGRSRRHDRRRGVGPVPRRAGRQPPPTAPKCSCGTATAAPTSGGPTPRAGS